MLLSNFESAQKGKNGKMSYLEKVPGCSSSLLKRVDLRFYLNVRHRC